MLSQISNDDADSLITIKYKITTMNILSLITAEGKGRIEELFLGILKRKLNADALLWLTSKLEVIKSEDNSFQLRLLFAQLPRFTGKQIVNLDAPELAAIISFFFLVINCRVGL